MPLDIHDEAGMRDFPELVCFKATGEDADLR
jgi:hypothetical protein